MLAPGARRLACAPPSPRAASGASRYAVSSRRGWIERGARDGRGVDPHLAGSLDDAGRLDVGGARGGAAGAESGAPAEGACFDGESRLDGLPQTTCTVTVTSVELPPHVANMGIVTFTASLPGFTAAEIHFGPDLGCGLVAPVGLAEPG